MIKIPPWMSTDDVMPFPSSYKIEPRILRCMFATIVIINWYLVWVHFSLQWPVQFRQRLTFLQIAEQSKTHFTSIPQDFKLTLCLFNFGLFALISKYFPAISIQGLNLRERKQLFRLPRIEEGLTLILLEFLRRKCKQCEIRISCNRR